MKLSEAVLQARKTGPAIIPYVIPGYPNAATYTETVALLDRTPQVAFIETTEPVSGAFSESTGEFIVRAHAVARRHFDPRWPRPIKPTLCVTYREHCENGLDAFLARHPGEYDGILLEWDEEERQPFVTACRARGIELVIAVGPGMVETQLKAALNDAEPNGLVYLCCAAITGGELLPSPFISFCLSAARSIRPDLLFAAGLGIRTPDHVRAVVDVGVDAVIVGTAFLEAMGSGVASATTYLDTVIQAARS